MSSSTVFRNTSRGERGGRGGGGGFSRVELGYESQRSVMDNSYWAAACALASYLVLICIVHMYICNPLDLVPP